MLALLRAAGAGHRKKLEEVARHWARGDLQTQDDHAKAQDALDEQFAHWGLVPDRPVEPEPEAVYLWPQNVPAWDLFMLVQTQWRGTGVGREGLDHAGVELAIDERRAWRTRRRQRRDEIRIMERAALEEWAKRAPQPGS